MSDYLEDWLKKCEGFRSHPYLDTTKVVTIGYGRNLDDNGISEEEAQLMLENDIKKSRDDLEKYDWYRNQPVNIKYALVNMCFNMGINRLLGFKKMIAALENANPVLAAQEALDSEWANQVGQRAEDVALMMKEGFYYAE